MQTNLLKFFNQSGQKAKKLKESETLDLIRKKTPSENKRGKTVEELIEKEVEDSLFHLGEWESLTSTIEKKYHSLGTAIKDLIFELKFHLDCKISVFKKYSFLYFILYNFEFIKMIFQDFFFNDLE